jgi:hypothetical protein
VRLRRLIGGMLWGVGFLLVVVGSVLRGPALGMGLTIENPHWEGDTLRFEFNGQGYQKDLPTADNIAAIVEITSIYTKAKADWDSILLEGQVLKVVAADDSVIYQTDTTKLWLERPLVGDLVLGQAAEWMVRLGAVGSIVGPLLMMTRRRWQFPLIWLIICAIYLI